MRSKALIDWIVALALVVFAIDALLRLRDRALARRVKELGAEPGEDVDLGEWMRERN